MEHKDIKFPWWIQNSIPTAYDDSLSIYEVWCKLWYHYLNLIQYLNKTICVKINEIITDRNNVIKSKINELIDSLSNYLGTIQNKINKEDELRINNTNTMNSNINNITINNEIIKKMFDSIADYSKHISDTLYNGTADVIKFVSYDENTNTLNVKQTNTDFINTLVSPNLTELTELSTTENTVNEWQQVEHITNDIEEVKEYE